MYVQTKYGKFTSNELYNKYNNMNYKELKEECKKIREEYNIEINLRKSKDELLYFIKDFYANILIHKNKTNKYVENKNNLQIIYNTQVVNGYYIALDDIPENSIINCLYYCLPSEDDSDIKNINLKYNVVQYKELDKSNKKLFTKIISIKNIKKGDILIRAYREKYTNKLLDNKINNLNILIKNNIKNRNDWCQWLLINHPDINPNINIELCQEIISAGRNIGY